MDAWHEAQIQRVQRILDSTVGPEKELWRRVMQVYKHTASCTKSHRRNALQGLGKAGLTEEEFSKFCDSDDLRG